MRRDSVPYAVEIPAKLTKMQQYCIDNYTRHVAILLSCCSSETAMLTRGKIWIYICATHKYKE